MPENFPASTKELRQKILRDMCRLGKMYLLEGKSDAAIVWFEAMLSLGDNGANSFSESWDDDSWIFEPTLGDIFRYGRGVKKDIATTVKLYEAEAKRGSREAKIALGEIYRDGEGSIQPDGKKAVRYFTEAAVDDLYYENLFTIMMSTNIVLAMMATRHVSCSVACIFTDKPSRKMFIKPRGGSTKQITFLLST